jgi:glucose/arabinose dehydrogenase/chitodextrinase
MCGVGLALLLGALPAHATVNFAPGVSGFTTDLVAGSLPFATGIAFAPDGRIFIALKSGVVRVWDGSLLPTPFVDLSAQVNDAHDRGLLGIAVHPAFPASPYLYLLFTHDPAGVAPDDGSGARVSRLVRVEADPAQGFDVALPGSQVPQTTPGAPGHWVMLGTNSTLANIGNPTNGRDTTKASCMVGFSMSNPPVQDCIPSDENSHSIGTLAFDANGNLFVSSGDGSNYTAVDPRALRSQNLDSLAGKILHIDPDTALGLPDNPFYQAANPGSNRSKVWAFGLRNPFRTAIHPLDGDAYAGDVGWSTWEEVNTGKGANFGWPCYEGGASSGNESGLNTSRRQPSYETNGSTSGSCSALYAQGLGAVKPPSFAWNHSTDGYGSSGGASAQAGAFYTGSTWPVQYRDALFIADYSRRWVRTLSFDAQGVATVANFAKEDTNGIVQVLRGPDTNLYLVIYNNTASQVRRIRYTGGGNTPPTAVALADPSSGALPLDVAFSAVGSYDPDAQPLGFFWDFGDGTSSTLQNPSHTYTASGSYLATLTVTEQTAPFASDAESVVITVGAVPPMAVISQPQDGSSFAIDDLVSYAGSATAGGFPLPPSALSWELRTHHNEHLHYDFLPVGAGGSFAIDDHADGVWLELCLTATDQTLSDTQCVDLLPRQTTVNVGSVPPGMHIVYEEEGVALTTPAIVTPTEGSTRTLNAPAQEQWRSFDRWSDGLASLSRQFLVGATPLAFSAEYVNQLPLASASATVGTGPGRLSVPFDSAGSSDPEGGALAYDWAFGDGQNGSGSAPTHVYAAPGSYVAMLTVSDPIGGTAEDTVAVEIPNAAPVPFFSMVAVGTQSVDLDATTSSDPDGDALAYAWDFGDGTLGSGPNVSHSYAAAGSYVITLGVSDPYLATAALQRSVTFGLPPAPPACGIGPELVLAIGALLGLRRRRARPARARSC